MNLKNNLIDTINKINLKSILGRRFLLVSIVIVATLCMVVLNVSASISPDFVQEELEAGEYYTVIKTVEIPTMPPEADVDVVFAFDLTVSMGDIISIAKLKAEQIMNTAIASYPGVSFTFGVMSYMDYPQAYSSCDYSTTYGLPSDYAYSLDQPLTDNMTAVTTAINNLSLGNGGDGPEDYTRIFYESYADSNIGWREGATKLLINFADGIPHDCNINEGLYPGTWSTGNDPGRDEIMGTSDDLDLQSVLASMNLSGVTLIECHKISSLLPYWNYWTEITGGSVYITSSPNLVDDVVNVTISELIAPKVYDLHLEVITPGYSSWLDSVIPSSYPEVDAGTNVTFEETICVPIDIPPGVYTFVVSAVDEDEVSYGNQTNEITVINNPPVVSDIPNQTIAEGESFVQINLDDYVEDVEDPDEDIVWTHSGEIELIVDITDRIATITTPNPDWFGIEAITFRATDTGGLWDEDPATFTVTAENDPPVVEDIPDQAIAEGGSFETINLDDFVSDVDNSDEEMTWTTSGEVDLTVNIDENRVATIVIPDPDWFGSETITFRAADLEGLWDEDDATFTVTAVNDPPVVSDIPDQTIAEGGAFALINLDDYVEDIDNLDSEITWTISGEIELVVEIDVDRVVTIVIPESDWFGSETITFTATDPGMLWDEDDATFTVTNENDPPVVGDIPDQTIAEGSIFATISLDDYVFDVDNPDDEIEWTYYGNSELNVSIVNRIVTIITPGDEWFGEETITFVATDPGNLSDEDSATFSVTSVNAPPYSPSNPSPNDGEDNVELDVDLSWTGGDPEGDSVTYDVYFGTSNPPPLIVHNQSGTSYNPNLGYSTTYYWRIIAWDNHNDSNASEIWSFTTESAPPGPPPSNNPPSANDDGASTNIDTSVWIDVLGNDDDIDGILDPSTVTVTIGPSDGSTTVNTTTGEIRYTPDPDFNGSDSFKYTVRDNDGATSNKATVTITVVGGVKADASAGSPYYGFVGEEITFNGSLSYDPDPEGYIVAWYWDFGDGTNGTGETTTHAYSNSGTYHVTLTVTDNGGTGNTDNIDVTIVKGNHPPSKPTIDGPITGHKNTTYEFTVLSRDLDNDTIKYYVDWGDGTVNESGFLPNGTAFEIAHSWTSYGEYLISVKAYDNETESETNESTILIDVLPIDGEIIGYLVDEDSDDIFDFFNNTNTQEINDIIKENNTYLIDSDGDSKWDHTYSQEKGVLTYYEYVYQKYYQKYKTTTPGFEIVSLLAMIAIVLIIMRRRKTMGV